MNSNKIIKRSKNKVKFLLTPRFQKDPLAADFDAPQNVLVPKDGQDIDKIKKTMADFDPTVFPSKEETKTGMLERAHNADGITFDPDIMEAMSKEFDYEDPNNILNDDFMDFAGGLIEDDGDGELPGYFSGEEDNDYDKAMTIQHDRDDDDDDDSDVDETRTVFTNYSMTSSVMRRNQGLQQLDEHFERLYDKEYADDTEIGPLDLNEVKGEELLTNIDQIRGMKKEIKIVRQRNHGDDYEPEIVSDHHKNAILGDVPGEEDEDLVEIEYRLRENRVDCESILSYNSNLYHQPKIIVEPRKKFSSQSTSDQMEVCQESKSLNGAPKSVASSRTSVLSRLSQRPANESPLEKKARKQALRQYRQERRQERKQNQQIFKSEQVNLARQQRTNQPALKLG